MLPTRAVRPFVSSTFAAVALTCLATPAAAQPPRRPRQTNWPEHRCDEIFWRCGSPNAYMFRGIRQENDGLIFWPYVDVGLTLFHGGGLAQELWCEFWYLEQRSSRQRVGFENPRNRKAWYESDFYTTLGFVVSGGVSVSATYTAYMSPNDGFTTVKEFSFKFGVDDTPYFGKAASSRTH